MAASIGKTCARLREMLQRKEISAVEIAREHLEHIAATESRLQSFNTVTDELALKLAARIDALIAADEPLPPLAGIPVAIKDNICLSGYPTTCSSKILEHFVPPYNATAVEHLLEAGAVIVGKTNMDEFAMGSSTENSAFKKTRNPWSLGTVPGGSSGGSASSVCAGTSVIALGSDTGGSIRQPAAFCGVAGMKPTYGAVSRYGLIAFASSLDQIGALARTVEDVALALRVIASCDPRDSTSYRQNRPDFKLASARSTPALQIGLISELNGDDIEPDVLKAIEQAVETLRSIGANVELISMPHLRHCVPVYYLIATAEASANLARFDGVRYGYRDQEAKDLSAMYLRTRQYGFGAEVKRRIMLGTYALSSGYYDDYYKKAQQVRQLIKQQFDEAFTRFDLLICPTSPSVAFPLGERSEDPLKMYLSDIATIPANLAGLPAVSINCGRGRAGLPVGLQIIGPQSADNLVLSLAAAFQEKTTFHQSSPEEFFPVSASA